MVSFIHFKENLHVKNCVSYYVAFVLISCDNYLIILVKEIDIRSKYSPRERYAKRIYIYISIGDERFFYFLCNHSMIVFL